ncbi:hypothetical protein X801_02622, partial [Opisthorchis viverrini]
MKTRKVEKAFRVRFSTNGGIVTGDFHVIVSFHYYNWYNIRVSVSYHFGANHPEELPILLLGKITLWQLPSIIHPVRLCSVPPVWIFTREDNHNRIWPKFRNPVCPLTETTWQILIGPLAYVADNVRDKFKGYPSEPQINSVQLINISSGLISPGCCSFQTRRLFVKVK